MIDRFEVVWSARARERLLSLHDFLLERAQSVEELLKAEQAIAAIQQAVEHQLGRTPFIFRRAGDSLTERELVIPFGSSGYVARFDVRPDRTVLVLSVRHQREDDYF